jgi:hypothetical protein
MESKDAAELIAGKVTLKRQAELGVMSDVGVVRRSRLPALGRGDSLGGTRVEAARVEVDIAVGADRIREESP